jgi:GR25 family glycosyltransferase involved in LPS biosynthesis
MNNPFDFFDKIFYINLDKRVDRRQRMEKIFEKFDIKAERFPAVHLNKEQNDELVERGCNFYDKERPEYAPRIKSCTLSHFMLLFQAKLFKYNNILILEDDAEFSDDVVEKLSACIEELQHKPWDMFYLGCNPFEYYKDGEHIGRVKATLGAWAVAIHHKFLNTLLTQENFMNYPCIDGYYGGFGGSKEHHIYMALQCLAMNGKGFSDIEGQFLDYMPSIQDRYKLNCIAKPPDW